MDEKTGLPKRLATIQTDHKANIPGWVYVATILIIVLVARVCGVELQ